MADYVRILYLWCYRYLLKIETVDSFADGISTVVFAPGAVAADKVEVIATEHHGTAVSDIRELRVGVICLAEHTDIETALRVGVQVERRDTQKSPLITRYPLVQLVFNQTYNSLYQRVV